MEKAGWSVTGDPYYLTYGDVICFLDLAAEQEQDRIAVEVKTFPGPSMARDLEVALGQCLLYRILLEELAIPRRLYLAVDVETRNELFSRRSIPAILRKVGVSLIVVNAESEEIVEWIP